MRGRGLSVEDSVALCIDRSIEMVICMLAIIKCGCAYVPIHPKFPNERISYMIKASGAKFTLTTSNYKHKFLVEEVIALEDIEGTLHNNSEENLEIGVHKKINVMWCLLLVPQVILKELLTFMKGLLTRLNG